MDKINYRITLDAHKSGVQKTLHGFFAGDVLSRRIVISLVGSSAPCVYGENAIAMMYVTKPDGSTSFNACAVEENTIFYDVLQADLTAGIVIMQCKIMCDEAVLYAPVFALEVQENMSSDEQTIATPTYTALEEALMKAETVYNERLVSIEISEDLIFTAKYADGSGYVSKEIKNAFEVQKKEMDTLKTNLENAEKDRISAESKRVTEHDSMLLAERERVESEEQRVKEFATLKNDAQGVLDEAEEILSKGGISKAKAQELINDAVKDYDEHLEDSDIHITPEERIKWNDNSGGNANSEEIQSILNGTTPVGDSKKLNGLTATEVGASGARNLIPYPYYETTKVSATGITFTDNGNGTITADGSATGNATFSCRLRYYTANTDPRPLVLPVGTYTLHGCPSGGNNGTYYIQLGKTVNDAYTTIVKDYGEGATFTLEEETQVQIQCVIISGTTVNNLTFKPMLEIGSVAHDDVPYHFGGAEHALDADTVDGYHIYSSLSELGLTEATATAESIVNAMADNSMLLHKLGSTATSATLQFPYNYSMLKVTKMSASYVSFECIGTGNLPTYYAYYNGGATTKWSGWSTQFLPLTGGVAIGSIGIKAPTPYLHVMNTTVNRTNRLGVASNKAVAYCNVDNNNGANSVLLLLGDETFNVNELLKLTVNKSGETSTSYIVLHTGNLAQHALSIDGGTLNGKITAPGVIVYRIVNDVTYNGFLGIANNGRAGVYHQTAGVTDAVMYVSPTDFSYQPTVDGVTTNYPIHHDGNSAKVIQSTSAPSDTTAVWVDTANKVTKVYIDGAWTAVGGLAGMVLDADPGVGTSVSYADNTLLFVKE